VVVSGNAGRGGKLPSFAYFGDVVVQLRMQTDMISKRGEGDLDFAGHGFRGADESRTL